MDAILLMGKVIQETSVLTKDKTSFAALSIVCAMATKSSAFLQAAAPMIVDGFFNMMMIVDFSDVDKNFVEISDELEKLGDGIGCVIRCYRIVC